MGGNVTSAGWLVTLCDPMWHVSSRSGVATLRTAIHLLLTYLLTKASVSAMDSRVDLYTLSAGRVFPAVMHQPTLRLCCAAAAALTTR